MAHAHNVFDMPNTHETHLPGRQAFLELGGWLVFLGTLNLAARSLARVWVDSARNQWVVPYEGELLLWSGVAFLAAGALFVAMSLQRMSLRAVETSSLRASILLFCAATAGLVASGIAQAWMHYSRLAIPGGWTHPRSLVAVSAAAAALGAVVFACVPRGRPSR